MDRHATVHGPGTGSFFGPVYVVLGIRLTAEKCACPLWSSTRLLLLAVLVLTGCRSIPLPNPPVEDVAPQRDERKALAIEQFEQNRNFAEFQASRVAYDRGDLRNSQAGLENLLRRAPQHRDARLLLATVLFDEGHHDEAIAQLQTALDDFPNDPDVHRAMGSLLEALNQPEDASAHFDRATKLAAQPNAALAGGTGSEVAGTAAATRPASGESAGASHSVRTGDEGGARHAFTAPAAALLRQGEEALAAGDPARGLAQFRQAAACEPNNPHIPTTAAIAALRQNRPDVAIVVAQEASAVFPRWTPLLRTLGTAHYRQGDCQSSQLVLQQALSLDKSDALAYFLLGCTHAKLQRPRDAEACFAEARRLNPSLATRVTNRVPDSLR